MRRNSVATRGTLREDAPSSRIELAMQLCDEVERIGREQLGSTRNVRSNNVDIGHG